MMPLIKRINSDKERILFELKSIGVDPYAYRLTNKGLCCNIKITSLSCGAANILKQEALTLGIDVAVAKGTVNCTAKSTDALILGDYNSVEKLIKKIKNQPFNLPDIAKQIEQIISDRKPQLKFKNITLNIDKPVIMGILNITPDSFSDGGQYIDIESIEKRLDYFLDNGVDIVDIGGESSRPGSEPISAKQELDRINPAIEMALKKNMIVSIDTYKFEVAENVLSKGVHIINDISGLQNNPDIAALCKKNNAALCIMHMKGTPKTMQNNPQYGHLVSEIYEFLYNSIELAVEKGLKKENIIVDVGFGFGKTLQNNYTILKNLNEFISLGVAILSGVSRKSMIGNVTNEPPNERILSSKIIETIAVLKGTNIVRTHDIKETQTMLKLINTFNEAPCG
jgi:dihydropteroate synthase